MADKRIPNFAGDGDYPSAQDEDEMERVERRGGRRGKTRVPRDGELPRAPSDSVGIKRSSRPFDEKEAERLRAAKKKMKAEKMIDAAIVKDVRDAALVGPEADFWASLNNELQTLAGIDDVIDELEKSGYKRLANVLTFHLDGPEGEFDPDVALCSARAGIASALRQIAEQFDKVDK